MAAINTRFGQKGFQKLETILTQPQHSEAVKEVLAFYGSDFHSQDRLQTQLSLLHSRRDEQLADLVSIVTYLKSVNMTKREYFSEVVKVVKLILVLPASEKSFGLNHGCVQQHVRPV